MTARDPHPIVQWELTRLCDQHCRGCPAGASMHADPNELSTYEAYKTIDQIAALQPRELILTGGNPLEREDVYPIIDYTRRRGLDPSLVLTPSRDLTLETLARLERHGLTRVTFSIDGSRAAIHESVHSVPDSFAATLRAMLWAEAIGLRIEVNTLVLRSNAADLDAIVSLIAQFHPVRWNVHFPVPIAASRVLPMPSAAEVESIFETLEQIRERVPFAIRVVEAPHYRRYRLQRLLESRLGHDNDAWQDFHGYVDEHADLHAAAQESAIGETHGFLYISHAGDVRSSEFAPHSAGNVRYRDLGSIDRGSDLLVALRDPDNLHGKCRTCELRMLCGGSRARAYAMTGDLFGADPLCAYEPRVT